MAPRQEHTPRAACNQRGARNLNPTQNRREAWSLCQRAGRTNDCPVTGSPSTRISLRDRSSFIYGSSILCNGEMTTSLLGACPNRAERLRWENMFCQGNGTREFLTSRGIVAKN